MRALVVGNPGAGKTTFCQRLSKISGIPHIELDSLNWESNWTPSKNFIQNVENKLKELQFNSIDPITKQEKTQWIVDGNNEKVREMLFQEATHIIYLDYPRYLTYWRLFIRTFKRLIFRTPLWHNNKEKWTIALSWNGILYWGWIMPPILKQQYETLFSKYLHLKIIRFNWPTQAENFINNFEPPTLPKNKNK